MPWIHHRATSYPADETETQAVPPERHPMHLPRLIHHPSCCDAVRPAPAAFCSVAHPHRTGGSVSGALGRKTPEPQGLTPPRDGTVVNKAGLQTLTARVDRQAKEQGRIGLIKGQNEIRILRSSKLRKRSLARLWRMGREGFKTGNFVILFTHDKQRFVVTCRAALYPGMVPASLAAAAASNALEKSGKVRKALNGAPVIEPPEPSQKYAGERQSKGLIERCYAGLLADQPAAGPADVVAAQLDALLDEQSATMQARCAAGAS
ncbi:MAG: hypothetical protein RQ741_02605 [Wenzhouxiangellaceae bacterium]|nr:hypothetical protein [Wenzhouxiangellaceae bacterium]